MKYVILESQLVAANPNSGTSPFVSEVMRAIRITDHLQTNQPTKIFWWQRLHRPAFALLAIVGILLASGAVYAAVHFAPSLIHLIGKETNSRGATEYSVSGFNECQQPYQTAVEKFEVQKDAPPLSDDDVKKIVQAKCEFDWIRSFVAAIWPTYGTNPQWKDGDTIYYTRTDVLGQVQHVSELGATLTQDRTTSDQQVVQGETLKAYLGGAQIPLSDIKPGDTVFSVVRVSETYYERRHPLFNSINGTFYSSPESNPQVLGLVALLKLSLPAAYYGTMQNYLLEVPACIGNTNELCPNTGGIDIYPRGEGFSNSHLKTTPQHVFHTISGEVTELGAATLILKSRSGTQYKIEVGDAGFADYLTNSAPNYTTIDATLKIGSRVNVSYHVPPGGDPKNIGKEQVQFVSLMIEGVSPKEKVMPY